MSPELWDRVSEVLDRILAAPPDDRPRLLAELCGPDAALRAEVESLLAQHTRARDFLETPASGRPADEPDDEDRPGALVGQRVGRYTLTRLIAAGGMGWVYEAGQENPRRSVALKLLKPEFGTRTGPSRFRAEAEILGRLHHPNVAQVYEAGVHPDGQRPVPYFAMELVPEATTLLEYAAAAGLTLPQRLELFAKVCDAVHHGHQKSIIHRDLKPGNILVGVDGEPKVIDFGVARATDADVLMTTHHTQTGIDHASHANRHADRHRALHEPRAVRRRRRPHRHAQRHLLARCRAV